MSRILGLFAVALFAVPMGAQAQESVVLDFTGTYANGNPITGDITLSGSAVSGDPGDFLITSVSGTINGESVSLLPDVPCPLSGCPTQTVNGFQLFGYTFDKTTGQGWAYDNIYYTGAAATANTGALDEGGIGLLAGGNNAINICQCLGPGSFTYGDEVIWPPGGTADPAAGFVPISLTSKTIPTPVPEPASLTLFGLGMAGLGLARRRRKN